MTFQIRGILNKITPEKFEKLTVDILNVGLDSTIVLKGVILLVSDQLVKTTLSLFRILHTFLYATGL